MPTTLDPASQAYRDRFLLSRSTATLTDSSGRRYAVTRCVFYGAHEWIGPQVRAEFDARDHALRFAQANLLRKFSDADPCWAALDEFALSIPEDERYW